MKKKILIVNGTSYAEAIVNLKEVADFETDLQVFMKNPESFMLVMFTGGADVSPSLYGHTSPKHMCGANTARDLEEVSVFDLALNHNIPMIGICRGSQFLNVMCGGVLVHHLDNHGIGGYHTMLSNTSDQEFEVTSTHHQMSIPGKNGHIVGWASPKLSSVFIGDEDVPFDYNGPEVEAICYPKHKVFAVQYHPEYMPKESAGYKWFNTGVLDLLKLTAEEFTKKYVPTEVKNLMSNF